MKKKTGLYERLERAHNYIYANEGLSRQEAFSEIVKVLLIKIFDERERLGHFFLSCDEKKKLQEKEKCQTFEKRMNDLFGYTKQHFRGVLSYGEKLLLKPSTLGYIVGIFEKTNLLGAGDLNGLVFQQFVSDNQKAERGQFFTPEPVVKMCVKMMKPKPGEMVLDPACGSGGFLIETMAKTSAQAWGIEINPAVARLAKLGIILGGGKEGAILNSDTLARKKRFAEAYQKWQGGRHENFADVIMTNPPFGTKGKIIDKGRLRDFELGYRYRLEKGRWRKMNKFQRGQVPEILFIERCLELLRVGGRMAIVLPQGELENPTYGYVRQFIRAKARVAGVIDLPEETFAPLGTSVKTSVLILEKKKLAGKKIFFGKLKQLSAKECTKLMADYQRYKTGRRSKNKSMYLKSEEEVEDRIDYEFNRPKYEKLQQKLLNRKSIALGKLVEIVTEKVEMQKIGKVKVKYVEVSDINSEYFEIGAGKEMLGKKLPKRAGYRIKTGDILVAMAGNFVGTRKQAIAIVSKKHDGAICSSSLRVLRNFSIDPYYLLYYTKSPLFYEQLRQVRVGSIIPAISEENLKQVMVVLPGGEEMEKRAREVREMIVTRQKAGKMAGKIFGSS